VIVERAELLHHNTPTGFQKMASTTADNAANIKNVWDLRRHKPTRRIPILLWRVCVLARKRERTEYVASCSPDVHRHAHIVQTESPRRDFPNRHGYRIIVSWRPIRDRRSEVSSQYSGTLEYSFHQCGRQVRCLWNGANLPVLWSSNYSVFDAFRFPPTAATVSFAFPSLPKCIGERDENNRCQLHGWRKTIATVATTAL